MLTSAKTGFVVLSFLLVFSGLASGGIMYNDQTVAKILKDAPVFSKEEMSQARFSASFPSSSEPTLTYALYNPCRDRSIVGILVTIRWEKDAAESAFDLFIAVECGPLQCRTDNNYIPVLKMEQAKPSPSVLLKEVYYAPLSKVGDASH